ncbi:hypothetical protein [Aquimarina sp. 2201CG1-2-11]|uniref:hypothetical protein n=1 Tax=Aquimarina discodermiae TaxID=3231043 RepID=UPI003461A054
MEEVSLASFLPLEICAAILGAVYFYKNKLQDVSVKYLVVLLWLTVFFEILALYPFFINTFEQLCFLEGTIFGYNTWVFNILIIISYSLYITYFRFNLSNQFLKKILMILVVFFMISTILNLIVSGVFFNELSTLTDVLGSLILLLSVLFYFFEVLQSDKVLIFYKLLPFYVSIGALVFHLVITPIDIYFEYTKHPNSNFFKIREYVLSSANIFMYTCYSIGFIVCLRKNKSY